MLGGRTPPALPGQGAVRARLGRGGEFALQLRLVDGAGARLHVGADVVEGGLVGLAGFRIAVGGVQAVAELLARLECRPARGLTAASPFA